MKIYNEKKEQKNKTDEKCYKFKESDDELRYRNNVWSRAAAIKFRILK